jgi:hypothetical protein
MCVFFSAFVLFGGLLWVSSGNNRLAHAASVNLQPINKFIADLVRPPDPMCVGSTVPVAYELLIQVPGESATVSLSANLGTLEQTQWSFEVVGGWFTGIISTEYTATEAAKPGLVSTLRNWISRRAKHLRLSTAITTFVFPPSRILCLKTSISNW